MKLIPRDFQILAENDIRGAYSAGHRAVCFVLGTGGGKTYIFSRIADAAAAKGKRVYIVAHRIEIVEQIGLALFRLGVRHGWIAPGHVVQKQPVMVAMIQSMSRRIDQLEPPDLLIVDECHHATAAQYRKLIAAWPKARVLGVTASPARTDGKGLGDVFNHMVFGPPMRELISRGYLASFRYFAPPMVASLHGVQTRGGDYAAEQIAAVMDHNTVTGDAIGHYEKHLNGAPAIVFCATVAHAQHVADQFRFMGWKAASVDGAMHLNRRKELIQSIGDGRLNVLTSCDVISEGTDIPAVSGAVLLRPTQSLIVYLQQVGRVLRPKADGSAAVILDHVGNVARMGMPDEPREWTLEGRSKRPPAPPVRQCPKCYAAFAPAPKCPACNYVFPIEMTARQIARQRAGELAELQRTDPDAWMKTAPFADVMKQAKTLEGLKAIAKARGYKSAWVHQQWSMKQHYRRAA